MPAFLFNAPSAGQQRLYLDESGTLGYGGEIFTMAMVLVRDLPKLEACTLKNRITQSEVKASQMKTAQKLALARTLLDENDIEVYLAKLDPIAAMVCERKLDKELLYDSMVAQALAFYLERGDLERGLPYRISMDMRGGLRESYEDMVAESVGNVLMHRPNPLVTSLDARFLDSKYSAGVQAADLFSNIYRTALTQTDSPCRSFLYKYQTDGLVHAGFTFGLVELADQMTQIAADLRARVELERAAGMEPDDGLAVVLVEEAAPEPAAAAEPEAHTGVSRSARRRRSRAARRDREAAQKTPQAQDLSTAETPAASAGAPEDTADHAAEKPTETTGAFEPKAAGSTPTSPAAPAAPARTNGQAGRETAAEPQAAEAPAVEQKAAETRAATVKPAVAPQSEKPPVLPFAPKGRMRTRTHRTRTAGTVAKTASTVQDAAHTGDPAAPASAPEPVNGSAVPAPSNQTAERASERAPQAPAPSEPQPQEAAEAKEVKVDVRPGRSVRSRQAAQAASRQRKRSNASANNAPTAKDPEGVLAIPNAPAAIPAGTEAAKGSVAPARSTAAVTGGAGAPDIAQPSAPAGTLALPAGPDEANASPEATAAAKKPASRRRRKPAAKALGDTAADQSPAADTAAPATDKPAQKTQPRKKAQAAPQEAEPVRESPETTGSPSETPAQGASQAAEKPAARKRTTPRRRKAPAAGAEGATATPGETPSGDTSGAATALEA